MNIACPNCNKEPDKFWPKITVSRSSPLVCRECGTQYFVHRAFSAFFIHGIWGSGVAFIFLILAFGAWGVVGIAAVIVSNLIIWLAISYSESLLQSPVELTDSMKAKGKKYLFLIRLIVLAAIIFVVFKVMSV